MIADNRQSKSQTAIIIRDVKLAGLFVQIMRSRGGTRVTAKEYLQQAYKIDKQITNDLLKIEGMKDSLHGKSISYENDGSQHNPSGNSIENAICKVLEYEEQINAEIDKLVDKKREIEQTINKLTDDLQREVLTRRYLLFQTWDGYYDKTREKYMKGIYDEMHYSRRRIFQLHVNALNCIELHLQSVL